MKSPALVIMAAGMGSRFGGIKQMTPIDAKGHIIMDYSLYDAYRAGFRKVVFIIKRELEADFKAMIGERMEKHFDVRYVYQQLDKIPEGFSVPEGRVKPWGTAHAVLCAANELDGPFAVINADDFYGSDAFKKIYDFLCTASENEYAMVGYKLKNVMTENGYVSRGVCSVENGLLTDITELVRIEKDGDNARYTTDDGASWQPLSGETQVSMNLWGFTPQMLDALRDGMADFLAQGLLENPLKCEYQLPNIPKMQLKNGEVTVQVLQTSERWYGVTYHEDLPGVVDSVAAMIKSGKYPEELLAQTALV